MTSPELIRVIAESIMKPPFMVEEWLKKAVEVIEYEVVSKGYVPINGIGILKKITLSAEPKEENGQLVLAPPQTIITLLPHPEQQVEDVMAAVATTVFGSDESDAKQYSRSFVKCVKSYIDAGKSVNIGKLGSLSLSPDTLQLRFVTSLWALTLFEKSKGNLKPIVLSPLASSSGHEKQEANSIANSSPAQPADIPLLPTSQPEGRFSSPPPADSVSGPVIIPPLKEQNETALTPEKIEQFLIKPTASEEAIPTFTSPPDLSTVALDPNFVAPHSQSIEEPKSQPNISQENPPTLENTASHTPSEPPKESERKQRSYIVDDPYYEAAVPNYKVPENFSPVLNSGFIHHDENAEPEISLAEIEEELQRQRQRETRRNLFIMIVIGIVIIGGIIVYQITFADKVNAIVTQKLEEQERAKAQIQEASSPQEEKVDLDSALAAYRKEMRLRDTRNEVVTRLSKAGSTAKLPPILKKPIVPSKGGHGILLGTFETHDEALMVGTEYTRAKISTYIFKQIDKTDTLRHFVVAGQFPTASNAKEIATRFKPFFPANPEVMPIKKP